MKVSLNSSLVSSPYLDVCNLQNVVGGIFYNSTYETSKNMKQRNYSLHFGDRQTDVTHDIFERCCGSVC